MYTTTQWYVVFLNFGFLCFFFLVQKNAACAISGVWNCVTVNPLNIAAGVWMV